MTSMPRRVISFIKLSHLLAKLLGNAQILSIKQLFPSLSHAASSPAIITLTCTPLTRSKLQTMNPLMNGHKQRELAQRNRF